MINITEEQIFLLTFDIARMITEEEKAKKAYDDAPEDQRVHKDMLYSEFARKHHQKDGALAVCRRLGFCTIEDDAQKLRRTLTF